MEPKTGMPAVDAFFGDTSAWREELKALRALLLQSGLTETLKWGKPCYTLDNANVAILYRFKDCAAVGFFKGALLEQQFGMLVKPGDNSQAMRMAKFTSPVQIAQQADTLLACIAQAIATERAGLSIAFQPPEALTLPAELTRKFEQLPALRDAFFALTPGRQRGYVLHFSQAKQSSTREARIERCIPAILEGKGLSD